jgi:hypothetical protein
LPTRNGLDDLDLFAGTGVLDKMPDVDDALVAGVGTLEASVMRLYGVVAILSGWVRVGCARLCGVHSFTSFPVGRVPGSGYSCGANSLSDAIIIPVSPLFATSSLEVSLKFE